MSLIAGLKMEGIVKWRGLKSQGQLYLLQANPFRHFHSRKLPQSNLSLIHVIGAILSSVPIFLRQWIQKHLGQKELILWSWTDSFWLIIRGTWFKFLSQQAFTSQYWYIEYLKIKKKNTCQIAARKVETLFLCW